MGAWQRSRGPLLLHCSLCCFCSACSGLCLSCLWHSLQNNAYMLRHTPHQVLGHIPRDQRRHWLCLGARVYPVSRVPPVQRAARDPFVSAACPGPAIPSVPSAAGHLPGHPQPLAGGFCPHRAEHQFSLEAVHQRPLPGHTWCSLWPQHPWRHDGESVQSCGSCQHALMGLRIAVLCSPKATRCKALSLLLTTM